MHYAHSHGTPCSAPQHARRECIQSDAYSDEAHPKFADGFSVPLRWVRVLCARMVHTPRGHVNPTQFELVRGTPFGHEHNTAEPPSARSSAPWDAGSCDGRPGTYISVGPSTCCSIRYCCVSGRTPAVAHQDEIKSTTSSRPTLRAARIRWVVQQRFDHITRASDRCPRPSQQSGRPRTSRSGGRVWSRPGSSMTSSSTPPDV